ncbi:molecular chaperone DnaJ [Paraburkholderia fungorum]|uniref:molecular chaperone DnaJ n=1 Tax=Paraburkholderia fungorum TaxID=134537 RepID=UPI0038B7F3C3
MAEFASTMARNLLAQREDARLKEIYNRHSGSDYDREAAAELKDFKANLEEMLGTELGDDLDMSSRDEVLARVHALRAQHEAKENAANKPPEDKPETASKKSAQRLAAEKRHMEEGAQRNLSLRELYRKLASELHPDRESDPETRKSKTALMQRANDAYNKRNLLQLLELQLELEHLDQNAVNAISEERLKYYNQILKQQVADLDQEIVRVETDLKATYGLDPYDFATPKDMTSDLAYEILAHQQWIVEIQQDLTDFEDIRNVKIWLKEKVEEMKLQKKIARIDISRYLA